MARNKAIVGFLILGFFAWFFLAFDLGCGSRAGQIPSGGGNNSVVTAFNNCYDFGVSRQSADDLYQTVLDARAAGFSFSEISQIVFDTCPSACYYETLCSNGCTSCSFGIVSAAYNLKSVALPTERVSTEGLIEINLTEKIREIVKNE